ncbi:MAG: bifunctional acetate--CoA ligase family protein/GNAT family N-acetyltransferase [Planctomycetota bacterium]
MSILNLDKIFRPYGVAVIGATDRPGAVGQTVLHNLVGAGFAGPIYPVNPRREMVSNLRAFPNVATLPSPPDLAIICTPAATVPGLVAECGAAGIRGIVILTAGFQETGAEGKSLQDRIQQEAKKYPGLRIVGPTCLGVIVPGHRLNASFAGILPEPGKLAFISQSGALCTSILDWAKEERIGLSMFVSIGNMIDVNFGDLIDYFGSDPQTRAIILYVESIKDPRRFMSSARAVARNKPIIAYKSGRCTESAKAASSHTGAMAGEDAVFDAAFERAGIVRVFEMDELFDVAELLAKQRTPRGGRLGIVTNAGGPGVMATDALVTLGGKLATLAPSTLIALDAALPFFWSHGNPVDILGDASPERYVLAARALLDDPNVDALLLILTPQAMTDPTKTARAICAAVAGASKPVLATWIGGPTVREGIEILNQGGVATYATPERAIQAFLYLVQYARNLETLYETPRDLSIAYALDRDRYRELFRDLMTQRAQTLSEAASKTILSAYEIPVTKTYAAHSDDQAAAVAEEIGFPVVLKVYSPDITHKTEAGGVELNLADSQAVRDAYSRIVTCAKRTNPSAHVEGVTVQNMVRVDRAVELIVGAKRDATFGSVLMVGMGGVTAELLRDRAIGMPPLNERLARRMLESLRCWPLLVGFRGRPPVAVEKLVEVILRISSMIAHFPEIVELDINPLLVFPDEVLALDARIVIDPQGNGDFQHHFAHLSIRPYPDEYVRLVTLKSGMRVTLRPIRPEDEGMWMEMLRSCTEETLYRRFFSHIKRPTHEMAIRFCVIDYDREMAIVAETEIEGKRQLLGVGRLVADPDHERAEYAVLVADPWQGLGLGAALTDYCLQLTGSWGIQHVFAETLSENAPMISLLLHRGFRLSRDAGVVIAQRDMAEVGKRELTSVDGS